MLDDGERVLEASDEEVRSSQVPVALHGQRLDRALAQMVPEFSRSYLQQLIEQGDALIDGRVVTKVSTKVRLGHKVQVTLRATPQSQALAKSLKKEGFTFCGPTITYAFMQAVGMVNDHLTNCHRHPDHK